MGPVLRLRAMRSLRPSPPPKGAPSKRDQFITVPTCAIVTPSRTSAMPPRPIIACHVQPGDENQCVDDEEMANGLLFVGNRMKEEIKALQTQLGLDEANPLVRSMR